MEAEILKQAHIPPVPPPGAVRLAAVQMDIEIGAAAKNTEKCRQMAVMAKAETDAAVVVFPECSLTGYCFKDSKEALNHALPLDDDNLLALRQTATKEGLTLSVGFLERTTDDRIANTALLITPQGKTHAYRKTHLPHLGVDRWTQPGGGPFEPVIAGGLSLGTLICYDASFPEAARSLALRGMEVLLIPTNWPAEAVVKADWLPNTRAYENVVYSVAVNRVGEERGFVFHGRSRICGPTGEVLVQGPADQEAVLVADIFPEAARNKKIERRGSEYWVDRIGHRRPELYDNVSSQRDDN